MNSTDIKMNMMVHAQDAHVGTVDHMDGDQWIKLKKTDADDGRHHWIPLAWVERTDATTVFLNKSADEFKRQRRNEQPPGLPGERATSDFVAGHEENAAAEDGTLEPRHDLGVNRRRPTEISPDLR